MSLGEAAVLVIAGALAGAINSVAGGGTLVSFPALVAMGLPAPLASATNAVAIAPASAASAAAYRTRLRFSARLLVFVSLVAVGAGGGAVLLKSSPRQVFERVVVVLIAAATLLVVFRDAAVGTKRACGGVKRANRQLPIVAVATLIFLVAIYGGYFGAGLGVITLAILSLGGESDIHVANAEKSLLVFVANLSAALYFFGTSFYDGKRAALILVGGVFGGYFGARMAQRVSQRAVRIAIAVIGAGVALGLAWRSFGRA